MVGLIDRTLGGRTSPKHLQLGAKDVLRQQESMKNHVQCQQPELAIRIWKTTVKVGRVCGCVAFGRVLEGSRSKKS